MHFHFLEKLKEKVRMVLDTTTRSLYRAGKYRHLNAAVRTALAMDELPVELLMMPKLELQNYYLTVLKTKVTRKQKPLKDKQGHNFTQYQYALFLTLIHLSISYYFQLDIVMRWK